MSDAAIRAVDLFKEYEGGTVQALRGICLEIAQGEVLCLMGPSGSGKSTFLHMIGALDAPSRGEVYLNGRPLSRERDLDSVRAREVGFIFQLHNLIPTLTSAENVEIPMMALDVPRAERRRRADELLEAVQLGHRRKALATRLSGGERQRVAIARALANRPKILLADEPTGDLDSATGEQVMACLLEARRAMGATLVLVTHNPELSRSANRTLHLKDGRLQ